MKKVFEWLTGEIFGEVGKIIDDVVTTKEEKIMLQAQIQEMLLNFALKSQTLRAAILEVEMKGNWLQRSWRPIVMLAFASIVVFQYGLYPIIRLFNPEFPELPVLEHDFWQLLSIGIGGYVVGRTVEKVVPNINFNKTKK